MVSVIASKMTTKLCAAHEFDDIYQDAVIGLIDATTKFDSRRKGKFETYASYRIRGQILDGYKNRNKYLKYTLYIDDECNVDNFYDEADELANPIYYVIRDEENHLIRKTVDRLAKQQRNIMRLKYWADLKQHEISDVLNVTCSRISYAEVCATINLRRKLKEVI